MQKHGIKDILSLDLIRLTGYLLKEYEVGPNKKFFPLLLHWYERKLFPQMIGSLLVSCVMSLLSIVHVQMVSGRFAARRMMTPNKVNDLDQDENKSEILA